LTVLRDEHLVSTRREGKGIYYSINSPETLALIETLYRQFCSDPRKQIS
jgi:DNA-binding transcriptional ArsR family regulator